MTIKNKMLLGALLLVTSAAWAAPIPRFDQYLGNF